MTPKEKAEELHKKSLFIIMEISRTDIPFNELDIASRKLSMMWCSEIIYTIDEMADPSIFINGKCENNIDFWAEVKEEISKL